MPRKPKITPSQVTAIVKRLANAKRLDKAAFASEIAETVKVSQTTVERVRADYNAITLQNELSRLAPDDSLADIEYKRAERRARGVNKVWRDAIVKGMRDSISLKDLIDPLPDDPRRASVLYEVDPQHAPVVLSRALTKTQRDSH